MEMIIALSLGLVANVILLAIWWLKLSRQMPVVEDARLEAEAGQFEGPARKRSDVQAILAQPLLDYLISYWGYVATTLFIWVIALFATTVALVIADPAIRQSVQDFVSFLQAVQILILRTFDALTFSAFGLLDPAQPSYGRDPLIRAEWFSFGAMTGLMAAKLAGEFIRGLLLVSWYATDPARLMRAFKYPGADRGLFSTAPAQPKVKSALAL